MGSLNRLQMGCEEQKGAKGGCQFVTGAVRVRFLRWGGADHGSEARNSALVLLNLIRVLPHSLGVSSHIASEKKNA